ncbi:MAG TPA: hypothetical protein VN783_01155 [Thermoanaerobaculia bacterium]|nr:hypothetical protein [Thermoanaerobaculia bacterium]
MFESLREPTLADRIRVRALASAAAFLIAQLYADSVPLFGSGRLRFEAIRLVLLAGVLIGFAGGLDLFVRHRFRAGARAWAWLALAVASAILCGALLASMSLPFLI